MCSDFPRDDILICDIARGSRDTSILDLVSAIGNTLSPFVSIRV